MRSKILLALVAVVALTCGFTLSEMRHVYDDDETQKPLRLGAFSMSLNVKDLQASKAFYEKMGFRVHGGSEKAKYLVMRNGDALVGLFQGFFEGNILTFNPGWDVNKSKIEDFDDVRQIHAQLKADGFSFTSEGMEGENGPGYFTLNDPDGNQILIDQHR